MMTKKTDTTKKPGNRDKKPEKPMFTAYNPKKLPTKAPKKKERID